MMITAQQARNNTNTEQMLSIEYKVLHNARMGAFWTEAIADSVTEQKLKQLGYNVTRINDTTIKLSW